MSAFAQILNDLNRRGGLKGVDVANVVQVSQATVSRWLSGMTFPHPRMQMLISDLRYVVDRLADYYTPEETRIWLYSKHPMLNGERAIDLLHRQETEKVLEVIEQLDSGVYL